jgi:hypothetical protein
MRALYLVPMPLADRPRQWPSAPQVRRGFAQRQTLRPACRNYPRLLPDAKTLLRERRYSAQ